MRSSKRHFGYGSAMFVPETYSAIGRDASRKRSEGNVLVFLKVSVTQGVGFKASSIDTRSLYVQFKMSLDQLDTAHPLQVTQSREGIHHAHLFLAALEQHEAFVEEEYAPIRKIIDCMHTALVSSAIQTKISEFFKPALHS